MAKKLKGRESRPDPLEGISESAQQIWAAGMAAFEEAQKQGGKLLSSLLLEGQRIQSATSASAESTLSGVRETTAETRDKLEKIFDERVSQAMARLGIPGRQQLDELSARIDALESEMKTLQDEPAPEMPSAPEPEDEDDLRQISGIGPAMAGKLNEQGITSYRQLAALQVGEIAELEKRLRAGGRFARNDWVAQAKRLHAEKYSSDS
jgi:poly(hydroxyalkanoate) granule-associated protein